MASPHILRWVSWTVRRNRDFGQAAYYRGLVEGRVISDLQTEGVSDYSMCFDHLVGGTAYALDIDRLSYLDAGLRQRVLRVSCSPALSLRFE